MTHIAIQQADESGSPHVTDEQYGQAHDLTEVSK